MITIASHVRCTSSMLEIIVLCSGFGAPWYKAAVLVLHHGLKTWQFPIKKVQFWSMHLVQNMSVWCKTSMLLPRMPFNTFCGHEQHLQTQRAGFILHRDKNKKGSVIVAKIFFKNHLDTLPSNPMQQVTVAGFVIASGPVAMQLAWLQQHRNMNRCTKFQRKYKNLAHISREKCARNQK